MNGPVDQDCLRLSGTLCLAGVDELVRGLQAHIADAAAPVVRVDLAGVVDVDTAALQVLVAARRTAEQAGKSLVLSSANETVRDRLRLTGLLFLCE
ncbi:MAG: STAS domain-containing protein [Magnetococcus sp. DMHC-8]